MKTMKMTFALLTAILLCLPMLAAAQEEDDGGCPAYVTDVQGDVEYTEDEEEWVLLEVDSCVYPGDIIRTGDDSAVAMVLGGDALIRVNANSDFQLWNEDPDSDVPDELDMELGEILTTLVPEEEGQEVPFAVNTPSGVVAVKGTEFFVAVDDEGKSEIKCLEGVVEVFNELGSVLAQAGMATELLGGVMPAEAFGFDMAEFNEYLGWANALATGDIKKFLKNKVKEEVKKRIIGSVLGGGGGFF